MNVLGLVPVALGVTLIILGWRGTAGSVWQMLTGHLPGGHTVGDVTAGAAPGGSPPATFIPNAPLVPDGSQTA